MSDGQQELIAQLRRVIAKQSEMIELHERIDGVRAQGEAWVRAASADPEALERLAALGDSDELGWPEGMGPGDAPDRGPDAQADSDDDAAPENSWLGSLAENPDDADGE